MGQTVVRIDGLRNCCIETLRRLQGSKREDARVACTWCNQGMVHAGGTWGTDQKENWQ